VEMTLRAGYSADLSGPVATRAVCHVDNGYYLSDVDILALCGKTNTQSNTAFRGFGGPQGGTVQSQGYAAAISIVQFVIVAIVSLAALAYLRRKETLL